MGEISLITDKIDRARCLARDLQDFRRCTVYDLYDDAPIAALPEILLADIEVLDSDAILRLRRLAKVTNGASVPFLFLMHDNGPRAHVQAMALGATTMLSVSASITDLTNALASLCGHPDPLPLSLRRQSGEARQFFEAIFADQSAVTPALVDTGTELVAEAVREAGVRDWVRAVRCFDDATHQHCLLVAGLAAAFSGTLGLRASDRHRLTKAALLHDVGKTQIPRHILNKPGSLDAGEMAIMRTHAAQGHAMLIDRGFEDIVLRVVRSHHEMLDGSGYPDKLSDAEIPDLVRLVTICDIYGALIEHRPYRPPMPYAKAYGILQSMSGRLEDDLVRAFRPVALAFALPGGERTPGQVPGSLAGLTAAAVRQGQVFAGGPPHQIR